MSRKWVVLKFGGTSVSQVSTWQTIASHTESLLRSDPELNVFIVVSALSQVTNKLEQCVHDISNFKTHLDWIKARHQQLATELKTPEIFVNNSEIMTLFSDLEKLLEGIQLTEDNTSPRLTARVLAFGEMFSSKIGQQILNIANEKGQLSSPVEFCEARDLLFATQRNKDAKLADEDRFLNSFVSPLSLIHVTDLDNSSQTTASKDSEVLRFQQNKFKALLSKLDENKSRVVITQGFIASTIISTSDSESFKKATCLLGRGGGDTSGALFSCLLNAVRFEVWTDVHGLFTSDPRNVKNAKHILELSYREAQELAAMGAKVLHPRSLIPCSYRNIPVQIHNTFNYSSAKDIFTRIVSQQQLQDKETTVMAIAKRSSQVLITLTSFDMWATSGFLLKFFEPFERFGVSVDLIATSQYSVSVTLDYIPGTVNGEIFNNLVGELELLGNVTIHKNCSVVSIVGRKLKSVLHLMSEAFKCFQGFNVLLMSESSEDLNMSYVIDQSNDTNNVKLGKLVCDLHKVLLEDKNGFPEGKVSLFGKTMEEMKKEVEGFKPGKKHSFDGELMTERSGIKIEQSIDSEP